MEAIEERTYRGHTIEVYYDNSPEDPREWDGSSDHMICFHKSYQLGDKHKMSKDDLSNICNREDVISLPVYCYDHSGIAINTTGFHCPWDSGQVGRIYMTYQDIKEQFDCKSVTETVLKKAYNSMKDSVKLQNDYVSGDVFEYNILGSFSQSSCCGFYGVEDKEYMIDEAKGEIDIAIKEAQKIHFGKLKHWIRNKLDLSKRIPYLTA